MDCVRISHCCHTRCRQHPLPPRRRRGEIHGYSLAVALLGLVLSSWDGSSASVFATPELEEKSPSSQGSQHSLQLQIQQPKSSTPRNSLVLSSLSSTSTTKESSNKKYESIQREITTNSRLKPHKPQLKDGQNQQSDQQINPKIEQSINPQRVLQSFPGPLGPNNQTLSCHHELSTLPVASTTIALGYIFAIASDDNDDDGVAITTLGFHVDPRSLTNSIQTEPTEANPSGMTTGAKYEVYVLTNNGFYADPQRDAVSVPLTYDFRGDLSLWTKIAEGVITVDDLLMDPGSGAMEPNYFRIPIDEFTDVYVPPNGVNAGGVRSFYVTLETNGILYADLAGGQTLNDAMFVTGTGSSSGSGDVAPPKLFIGEGIVEYPFPNSPYLYQPKLFVGKIYYETECESMAPSTSSMPSSAPSMASSTTPSMAPSISSIPSSAPSNVFSSLPSSSPSSAPSTFSQPVSSGLFLSLNIGACQYDAQGEPIKPGDGELQALEETVSDFAMTAAASADVVDVKTEVVGVEVVCLERRGRVLMNFESSLAENVQESKENQERVESTVVSNTMQSEAADNSLVTWEDNATAPKTFEIMLGDRKAYFSISRQNLNFNNIDLPINKHTNRRLRKLPTASSALDFSMVITGEYRPITRPGGGPLPSQDLSQQLGDLTEDSINRDSDKFVKDLSSRAARAPGASSGGGVGLLGEVKSLEVKAVPVVEGQDVSSMKFTRSPTATPTPPPTIQTFIASSNGDDESNGDNLIIMGIVIIAGIMAVLLAFLLYRHAERRAIRKRRKKMDREMKKKEMRKMEEEKNVKWREENDRRHYLADGKSLHDLYDGGGGGGGVGGTVAGYGGASIGAGSKKSDAKSVGFANNSNNSNAGAPFGASIYNPGYSAYGGGAGNTNSGGALPPSLGMMMNTPSMKNVIQQPSISSGVVMSSGVSQVSKGSHPSHQGGYDTPYGSNDSRMTPVGAGSVQMMQNQPNRFYSSRWDENRSSFATEASEEDFKQNAMQESFQTEASADRMDSFRTEASAR